MPRKIYPPRNARERQLLQEWDKIVSTHLRPLERGAQSKGVRPVSSQTSAESVIRESSTRLPSFRLPSRVTPGSSTALNSKPEYTGDRLLGIAVLHKSCLQPVFSQEDAIEISRMRRG